MRSISWSYALVFLVPSLAGCISRQQMSSVVQAGLDASALGRQATADVRANLASSQGMEFIAAAMGTGVDPGKIEDLSRRTEKIRRLLLARQVMFAELEKMYRSLKTLADYDAACGSTRDARCTGPPTPSRYSSCGSPYSEEGGSSSKTSLISSTWRRLRRGR